MDKVIKVNSEPFLEYIKYHNMKVADLELIKSNNQNEPIVGGVFMLKLIEKSEFIDVVQLLTKFSWYNGL